MDKTEQESVIIVGAGIAGLAAARRLAEAGVSVCVFEANTCAGGRMLSQPVSGFTSPIELGAEFVHGKPEDLFSLIAEAGLEIYELFGSHYHWDGKRLSVSSGDDGDDGTRLLEDLRELRDQPAELDVSFARYLQQTNVTPEVAQRLTAYVEGFNAADAGRISVQALGMQQAAEDEIEGGRLFHITRGYSALIDYVMQKATDAGATILLHHAVKSIRWSLNSVGVDFEDESGETKTCLGNRVLVTVPLGVLQARSLEINPWPSSLAAIDQMAMGRVHRISLLFKERFWAQEPNAAPDLSFLFSAQTLPGVWWSSHLNHSPVPADLVLTGWIGGPRVQQIDASDLLEASLASLAHIFNRPRRELDALLVSSHHHDWNHDPLSQGAYSYVCTGGIHASQHLSEPVDGTFFLAGEHTDTSGHWGTVHGALRSGIRAADQILQSLKTRENG